MKFFFEMTVKCHVTNKKESTHLAIMNAGKIRYLIENDNAFRNRSREVLKNNVSTYSIKLGLLLGFLKVIPDFVLDLLQLGKKVFIELPDEIKNTMTEIAEKRWPNKRWSYNIIVGSYVKKQKIIIQCFTEDKTDAAIYFKICSDEARVEIENETGYLKAPIQSELFENPKLCYSKMQKDGARFNIQVTEEFAGRKVAPEMTQDIYRLFQEIANYKRYKSREGKMVSFSHGDFTPWNLRCTEKGYIIFDWEYCGMRFYGYDLIHYFWQIENKLNKENYKNATKIAVKKAQLLDEELALQDSEELGDMYLSELKNLFGMIY